MTEGQKISELLKGRTHFSDYCIPGVGTKEFFFSSELILFCYPSSAGWSIYIMIPDVEYPDSRRMAQEECRIQATILIPIFQLW